MRFKGKVFFILIISVIFVFMGCASSVKKNTDNTNNNTECLGTQNNTTNVNKTSEKNNSNNALTSTNEKKDSSTNANVKPTKTTPLPKISNKKNTKPENSKNKSNTKQIRIMGFIGKVYDKDGKKYLTCDNVNFLTGKAAVEAAKKDGVAQKDENGNYYVWDDYYIVNSKKQFKTYKISENATFNLCVYLLDSEGKYSNASITKKTTYAKFKSSTNSYSLLCYITIKNNEIINVTQQYIP
ncbi:hypothetical protein RBU49_13600 [Clostridium sp. MB40-C1]|uniref:hypothetical protein n=1 Tax=Clostridium sp. MB40-C1 TaxID=3070996 RepID=UPI0027E04450|nr:hypothetical protein [Clostridium sp. MB40-C1]WMJ79891.1 hypothetical protein RBU49_13600 [Clostridium sp. MB40-C1]